MDWLQFIAAVIGHLAWPSVILVLFVILRKHMGALADRLLEFSFGGAKITFDKILQRGAEIIEQSPQPQLSVPEKTRLEIERPNIEMPTLAQRSNAVKRLKAFRDRSGSVDGTGLVQVMVGLQRVDALLSDIGEKLGINAEEPLAVVYSLLGEGHVTLSVAKLYETLREARNVIAHSYTLPDEREAEEYLRQADYLNAFLIIIKHKIETGEIPAKHGVE
jgi:uncharacterized protein YutE (UPF0331/DUF86 family)